MSATSSGVGGGDDENGGDGAEIHTSPDKTAIMVGSIKCHIDYCPPYDIVRGVKSENVLILIHFQAE